MGTKYQRQAASLIQGHLTQLLQTQVNDPRVRLVTITAVEVTPDATRAYVYFTALGSPEEREEVMAGLNSAAGFLRREIGQRIRLRNTPELIFQWDVSIERGERISSLLDQLWDDEPEEPGSEP